MPVLPVIPEASASCIQQYSRHGSMPETKRSPLQSSASSQLDYSLSPTVRPSLENIPEAVCDDDFADKTKSTAEICKPCTTLAADPEKFNETLQAKLEEGVRAGGEIYYPEGGQGWVVVAGCFLVVAVTMGFGLAFGVFQQYYKAHVFPTTSQATLSLIGSLQGCVMTIIVFPLGKLQDRHGYKRFLAIGCGFAGMSMLTSAFCHQVWQFMVTQGVLQGIASGFIFPAICALPGQYFKRRRGLAIGIVLAGGPFGGGLACIIARVLLSAVGLRNTLLIHFGIQTVCVMIGMLLVRERNMVTAGRGPAKIIHKWYDKDVIEDKAFWGLGAAMLLSVFGYLPPIFYLAIYTKDVLPQLSAAAAVVPITLVNFAAAIGRVTVGFAADKIGPVNAFFFTVTFSGLVQLLFWNFAHTYPAVIAMSLMVGTFGGCFVSLAGPVAAHIYGPERLGALSGLLTLFNTPGNIAAAPLAGVILAASGGNWHALICYSGSVQIMAGLCMLFGKQLVVTSGRRAEDERLNLQYG